MLPDLLFGLCYLSIHRVIYLPCGNLIVPFFFISTQAGSQPITSVSWLPTLRLLVTISKDGGLQVWKTRVVINSNRQPMETNFFERAGYFCPYCLYFNLEFSFIFFRLLLSIHVCTST
jgi:WD40 repeat protein